MIPTRQQLIEVFNDTLKFFDGDSILHDSIVNSNNHKMVYNLNFAAETESHKAGKILRHFAPC